MESIEETPSVDPFEGSGGGGDPFEGDSANDLDPGNATAADEVAATPPADVPPADTPAEEPPIVNREGEPVETPAGPPATATAAGRAKLAAEGAEAPQEAADGPEAATAAPEAPETQTEGDGGNGAPPQDPPAPADAPPPPADDQEQPKKGEMRLYKLLYQTGPTTWEEADLSKIASELKQYTATDEGESFLKARNNDHARRIAWAIMGRPDQGVTVELVARTSWKPKRLSTAPPEPTRERLVIS